MRELKTKINPYPNRYSLFNKPVFIRALAAKYL